MAKKDDIETQGSGALLSPSIAQSYFVIETIEHGGQILGPESKVTLTPEEAAVHGDRVMVDAGG